MDGASEGQSCPLMESQMTYPLIAAALAMPKTHCVVTTYACGRVRRHETRNEASAENFAVGERRKVGKSLIDRMTVETVRVVSVEVLPIA